MRRLIHCAATVVAFCLWAVAPAAAEQILLKAAHFWPPEAMAQTKILAPWCAEIARRSNGRLACEIYPAMRLGGSPAQLLQQAMNGDADIVWTAPGYTVGRYPSVEAFELPFTAMRAETASRALWDYCLKHCREDFKGVKPLAFHLHDRGQVHTGTRPVRGVADFRDLKIRAPTRTTKRLLALLGATPITLPLSAVQEAMAAGALDGYLLPWEALPTLRLERVTRFHAEIDPQEPGLYTAALIIAMNQARYDSLPADLRQVIDESSGAAFSAAIGKAWDESAAQARRTVLDAGGRIVTLPAAETAALRRIGDQMAAEWVDEMKTRGRDGQAMLNDARALIAHYAAKNAHE